MRLLRVVLVSTLVVSDGFGGRLTLPFNPIITVAGSSILDAGSGVNDWVGRASVKRRPSDNALVMAYYKATNHFNNEGAVHLRFSDDDGATWTAEDRTLSGLVVSGSPFNPTYAARPPDAGEPQLYVAPNGHLLLHTWLVDYGSSMMGSWQWRSTDGGESWNAEGQIAFGINGVDNDTVFSTDDEFTWNGLIYAGARVYSGGADGVPSQSILIRSDDNGATWSKVSTIMDQDEGESPRYGGGQEVGIEYVGNKTIVAMIRDNAHRKSYQRLSTDLGRTWGPLVDVTPTVGIAGRQRVYTLSSLRGLDSWWKDPTLIMVGFVHQTFGDDVDRRAAVWISPDRGMTWDGPHYLNRTTEDGGYGDVYWDFANHRYVVITYVGSHSKAMLLRYDLDIDWA